MLEPEIIDLFTQKFHLDSYLSPADQSLFWQRIKEYMDHRRTEQLGGRTYQYLATKIDQIIMLLEKLELNKAEIVLVIKEFPSILNSSYQDIYNKFLILGIIEDDSSISKRKAMLILKPRDYVISIDLLFARYCFLSEIGYPHITYSILVHDSETEFAKKFIKKAYFKPYQIYSDIAEISSAVLIARYPFLEEAMNDIKAWSVNQKYNNNSTLNNSI